MPYITRTETETRTESVGFAVTDSKGREIGAVVTAALSAFIDSGAQFEPVDDPDAWLKADDALASSRRATT